jgi:predicted O-methyltransferase YrrM
MFGKKLELTINLKIGPSGKTLKELLLNGMEGMFDFIFIDADKDNQLKYYELSLKLVRRGRIIAVDNVLWVKF